MIRITVYLYLLNGYVLLCELIREGMSKQRMNTGMCELECLIRSVV